MPPNALQTEVAGLRAEIASLKAKNAALLRACRAYRARQRNPLMDFSLLADVTELVDKAIALAEQPE